MDVELAEVRDFLAQHAPYDALPRDELDRLVRRLEVRYARRGSHVLDVGEHADAMFVLRSGAIDIRDGDGALVERADPGTSFGMSALLEGDGTSRYEFVAIEDSLLLAVPGDSFLRMCADHPDARRWFDRRHADRLHRTAAVGSGSPTLRARARDLVRRPPETAPAGITVREAAERMRAAAVSSLMLTSGDGLAGIVTDRDLRNRVVAAGLDADAPLSAVMTPDPRTVAPDTPAFELLLLMLDLGVHHLPVVEDGRVLGMVTSTDLMRLEHADPVHLVADVRRAADRPAVVAAAHRLPDVVQRLVDAGSRAEDVARVVTAVGDAVERRLLETALAARGPAPVPWCWVVLGSRARMEQALGADQDHALVLDDTAGEADDAWFAALAEEVSDGLVACGYPLCDGGVMARNPQWRRTVSGWRRVFGAWVGQPQPDAVLASSIAFDLRPLHGTAELATSLHAQVVAEASQQLFLGYLTRHALATRPPVGFFRSFVVESHGGHEATLDLKRRGLNPVVDLARVHALAVGTTRVNTPARLRAATWAGRLSTSLATELTEAYEVIAQVRLRHQVRLLRSGNAPDNHVRADELSTLERRHLRDAFGVVQQAQAGLGRSSLVPYL